jgi:hypothetical protein
MEDKLELVKENEILCLRNKEDGKILMRHAPLGTSINEFKRIKADCNIVNEGVTGFPKDTEGSQANIYCLDDKFNIKWKVTPPREKDCFPNSILWNKEMSEGKDLIQDNPNTFTCSSWRCVTITVDYETGKTLKKELTK